MNRFVTRVMRAAPAGLALAAALMLDSFAASPALAQQFAEFPDSRLKQGRAITCSLSSNKSGAFMFQGDDLCKT